MSSTSVSTLADLRLTIADLERQLAECRAARDEALQREMATAEVLGVINSSAGDLAPVFGAMLEASFGTLVTYDGELFAPAAAHGVPPAFAASRSKRGAFAAPSGSSLERVRNGESLVHIADVTTDPGSRRRRLPDSCCLIRLAGSGGRGGSEFLRGSLPQPLAHRHTAAPAAVEDDLAQHRQCDLLRGLRAKVEPSRGVDAGEIRFGNSFFAQIIEHEPRTLPACDQSDEGCRRAERTQH
jgi:hypothetical protein